MSKNRLKLAIWLGLLVTTAIAIYFVVTTLAGIVTYFSTGADPRSALNLLPAAPANLEARLRWQPDRWDGRQPEPFNRDKIAAAYLRAWAQWNIAHQVGQPYGLKSYFAGPALEGVSSAVLNLAAAGWRAEQADLSHTLELTFYADDGRAAAFTDHSVTVVQLLTHPDSGERQVIETTATFEVVMLLQDGNWQVYTWQRRAPAEPDQPALTARPEALMTVDGLTLRRDGRPYQIAGINYYPQATPWTEFWPNYDPAQICTDLSIIRSLGLNSITIFVPFEQFGGEILNEQYVAYLTHFLDEAERQNIGVVVTLFDHRTDHSLANWATDDRHLTGLIPRFAGHPAILAWNLKNEPDLDDAANGPELNRAWLRHVAGQVRRLDPHHLITIGWSSPAAAAALVDVVDVVSYHYYAPATDYPAQLAALQAVAGGKPLLLQEFGLPTWNSVFPNGHTEAEQAAYYAAILTHQRQANTAGYMAWTLYDFERVTLEQFRLPWQRGPQANMGLIRRDGVLKPAAVLVNPAADLSTVPPVPGWQRFTKPFWLLMMVLFGLTGLIAIWVARRFGII